MAEENVASDEEHIDPEAQATADLISKLMTTPGEDGTDPSDAERIRRLGEEEQRINLNLKINPGTSAEDNALFNRMISVANVRIGIETSTRKAEIAARQAKIDQTRAASAQTVEDYSDQNALAIRLAKARDTHRARIQSKEPLVYRGQAKPQGNSYQPPPQTPPDAPGMPTKK